MLYFFTMKGKVIRSWLIEFAPISLFYIIFEFFGFFPATAALVSSTVVSLIVAFVLDQRIALFPLISGASVLFFGGAALIFKQSSILALEYTLYNGTFGVVLLVGALVFKKYLFKHLFGSLFAISEQGWRILSLRWGWFFLLVSIFNEVIWRTFSEGVWVHFRIFVVLAFLAFGLCQFSLSRKERLAGANEWGLRLTSPRS